MIRSVLERIAGGNSAAMNECISLYGGLVWSLARRLTRTPADAEDATQEIFLNIWSSANAFDAAKGSETVFIATIARRRLIDRWRKSKAEFLGTSSVDIEETEEWTDPGTSPQLHVEAAAAMRALQQLRPEQRRMLELGFVHGLSQAAISLQLGIPLGTVKSHMRRGLIQVRLYMQIPAEPIARARCAHNAPLEMMSSMGVTSRKIRREPVSS
jgi:RNA polymerase sigma-70 factor, ECF subfamily